jgi:hypothetical protein
MKPHLLISGKSERHSTRYGSYLVDGEFATQQTHCESDVSDLGVIKS